MSLFHRRQEEEIDLSDSGLLEAAEALPEAAASADKGNLAGDAADPADPAMPTAAKAGLFPADSTAQQPHQAAAAAEQQLTGDLPDQEARWQQAAADVSRYWPQLRQDMPGLIRRMAEISARYGDETLWQRSPAGIMREAAVELYGMPAVAQPQAVGNAIRQAHAMGMQTARAGQLAKAGLAPSRARHERPAPCSEEEQILQAMAAARQPGIFF